MIWAPHGVDPTDYEVSRLGVRAACIRSRPSWLEIRGCTDEFYSLWARHVRRFDPRRHCQAALLGPSIRAVSHSAGRGSVHRLTALCPGDEWTYLCGLARRGRQHNLHLALRRDEGSEIELVAGRLHIRAMGWREVAVEAVDPALAAARGVKEEFLSCRCVRFALCHLNAPREFPL